MSDILEYLHGFRFETLKPRSRKFRPHALDLSVNSCSHSQGSAHSFPRVLVQPNTMRRSTYLSLLATGTTGSAQEPIRTHPLDGMARGR